MLPQVKVVVSSSESTTAVKFFASRAGPSPSPALTVFISGANKRRTRKREMVCFDMVNPLTYAKRTNLM
jgi:hypothetical protein